MIRRACPLGVLLIGLATVTLTTGVAVASPRGTSGEGPRGSSGRNSTPRAPTPRHWSNAIEIPGVLNAAIVASSCAPGGNCVVVEELSVNKSVEIVAQREVSGSWGGPVRITPQTWTSSEAVVASCVSPDDCSVAYADPTGPTTVVTVAQVNGQWEPPVDLQGPWNASTYPTSNTPPDPVPLTISCVSAGNCTAGGYYTDGSFASNLAFTANETDGTWQPATEISLASGYDAPTLIISCGSAGNCGAVGTYTAYSVGDGQAYVVSEVNGSWQDATFVPGLPQFPSQSSMTGISCASAGNCSAIGVVDSSQIYSFIVSEVDGTWGQPQAFNGFFRTITCTSAGNCSVDGGTGAGQFLMSEVQGVWGPMIPVHLPSLRGSTNNSAYVAAFSCMAPGSCVAGGAYLFKPSKRHPWQGARAFIVEEVGGTWEPAIQVPGLGSLKDNHGAYDGIDSVKCSSSGFCSAFGGYEATDGKIPNGWGQVGPFDSHAFVVSSNIASHSSGWPSGLARARTPASVRRGSGSGIDQAP